MEDIGDAVKGDRGVGGESSWDNLLGDLEDDKSFQDVNGDNVFVQNIV